MHTVSETFKSGLITWEAATGSGGHAGGIGTTVGNIDTTTTNTEQVRSGKIVIGPMPPGSLNTTWDRVTFDVTYTHVNNTNSATLNDAGRFLAVLRTLGGAEVASVGYTITTEDASGNAPIGTVTGTVTITYINIPPGEYYLHVGEPTKGDGERLSISVANGVASEDIPCFTAGVLIETKNGQVPVESLKPGDLVLTRDHGLQPVRWIGARDLPHDVLAQNPRLRPIRISAGALGMNTPAIDLIVSQQHRVLVRSKIVNNMFGKPEVLVAAKHLLGLAGVDVCEDVDRVEYFHLLFDSHEIVYSNGAETETLYTGKEALKAVGLNAQQEIFTIFPQLRLYEGREAPVPARFLVPGRQARSMVARHLRNHKYLVEQTVVSQKDPELWRRDPSGKVHTSKMVQPVPAWITCCDSAIHPHRDLPR